MALSEHLENMNNSTFIFISGLKFHAPVGVLEQEKVVGNDIIVDLRIGYPFSEALQNDNLDNTLNYAEVYNLIKKDVHTPVSLLERLAGKIASDLQKTYPKITSLDIRITKKNPPMGADCEGAGVEIHLINTKTEE